MAAANCKACENTLLNPAAAAAFDIAALALALFEEGEDRACDGDVVACTHEGTGGGAQEGVDTAERDGLGCCC